MTSLRSFWWRPRSSGFHRPSEGPRRERPRHSADVCWVGDWLSLHWKDKTLFRTDLPDHLTSLFPHLHYELRDGSVAKTVEGLPSYFSKFQRLLDSHTVDVKQGAVNTGDIVEGLVPGKK